jgi:membrane associated rhomboid family serine protease
MAFLQAGRGEGPFGGDGRQAILNVPPVVFWLIAVLVAAHVLRVFMPPATASMLLHHLAFVPQHVAAIHGWNWPALAAAVSFLGHLFVQFDATGLAISCLLLLVFGSVAARRFGSWNFLLLFGLSGMAGALLYLATSWNSPVGIAGASGGVAGVAMAAIRATWMRQARPTTYPPALASIFSPQVLAFLIFWCGLGFIFTEEVVLPTGAGTAIVWQPALAGAVAGMVLAEIFDLFVPKIELGGLPGS